MLGLKIGPSLNLLMDINKKIKAFELLKLFGFKIPSSFYKTTTKEASSLHTMIDIVTKVAYAKHIVKDGFTKELLITMKHVMILDR